ncbi:hypothetical protein [Kitasatospora aburaviensis]|uniref:Uncharacterized protein n=1 Tax=Kitasatospora aburaviensis TaxID=67265 RepID=A0ABW1F4E6_9ACTN
MRQSSTPAPGGTIEVALFGDGLRGAGRRLVGGGKRGPAFDGCQHGRTGGRDARPATASCADCSSVVAR